MNLIIIQARLKSTRLPEKVMLEVCGMPLLQHVVNRCRQSKADKVVVAVPLSEVNYFKNTIDAEIFGGDELDVLDRFYQCAKKYNADDIIRVTSDCPLTDYKLINDMIDMYNRDQIIDVVTNCYLGLEDLPDGFDLTMFSFKKLEQAYKNAKGNDREHVVTYFYNDGETGIAVMGYNSKYKHLRLAVDYPEDWALIEILYNHLYLGSKGNKYFGYREVVDFYNKYPEIFRINSKYSRNESYWKQKEK